MTVAWKVWACPVVSPARLGNTLTATVPVTVAVMVIVALAVLLAIGYGRGRSGYRCRVGTLAGAVYVIGVPDALVAAESVPQVAAVQPAPVNVQVTPLLCESF